MLEPQSRIPPAGALRRRVRVSPTCPVSSAHLLLRGTGVAGSGPTGPSVSLDLDLKIVGAAGGRKYRVEAKAVNNSGGVQGWDLAGAISVVRGAGDPEDRHR